MPLSQRQLETLQYGPELNRFKTALEYMRDPNRSPDESPVNYQPRKSAYLSSEFDRPIEERETMFETAKSQQRDIANLASSANAATLEAVRVKEERRLAKLAAESQARGERNEEVLRGIASGSGGGAFNDRAGSGGGYGSDTSGSFSGSTAKRNAVINAAKKWIGTPYLWGGGHGSLPRPGDRVDCSGLVRGAFSAARIKGTDWMNGTTYTQVNKGRRVPVSKLLPGDLVFSSSIGHVAIYLGKGKMIEAQQTGTNVMISNVRSGMFGVHLNY